MLDHVLGGTTALGLERLLKEKETAQGTMLMFYEQNNIAAFKQIFIEQYEFAVKNYFYCLILPQISGMFAPRLRIPDQGRPIDDADALLP